MVLAYVRAQTRAPRLKKKLLHAHCGRGISRDFNDPGLRLQFVAAGHAPDGADAANFEEEPFIAVDAAHADEVGQAGIGARSRELSISPRSRGVHDLRQYCALS